jgi:deoxyribodipyrimidine photo-lyase
MVPRRSASCRQPALEHAVATGHPVVCVYVYDPELRENRLPGAAARWWLHESLRELNAALGALGGGLAMFRGPERQVIEAFAAGIGAIKVCWNRRYSVAQRETDAAIKATLRECGIAVSTFNGHLLREPWSVATRDARRPFQVFSAYWRAARREYSPEPPRPAPGRIDFFPVPESAPARVNDLSALALQPYAPDWAGGLRETWQCGEEAGQLPHREIAEAKIWRQPAGRMHRGDVAAACIAGQCSRQKCL